MDKEEDCHNARHPLSFFLKDLVQSKLGGGGGGGKFKNSQATSCDGLLPADLLQA